MKNSFLSLIAVAAFGAGSVQAAGPALEIPGAIDECETAVVEYCGSWTWNGHEFDGHWGNGIVATLHVERFAVDGVIIKRVDTDGPSPGLTAVYTGKLNGDTITDGAVVWTYKGRSYKGTWKGTARATIPLQAAPVQ